MLSIVALVQVELDFNPNADYIGLLNILYQCQTVQLESCPFLYSLYINAMLTYCLRKSGLYTMAGIYADKVLELAQGIH